MATLRGLPAWAKSLGDSQYAYVAYTGLATRANTTRWFRVQPGPWRSLRHHLESFGPEKVESDALKRSHIGFNGRPNGNTCLRAFELCRIMKPVKQSSDISPALSRWLLRESPLSREALPEKELRGDDYVFPNHFLLLVRCAMPVGARAFVPLEEQSKYALLMHTLDGMSLNDPNAAHISTQLQVLRADQSDRFHAADRAVERVTIQHPLDVSTEHSYSVPPKDYFCYSCKKFGHHFQEACSLFSPAEESREDNGILAFGAAKFGKAKGVQEQDAHFYSMRYNKRRAMHNT